MTSGVFDEELGDLIAHAQVRGERGHGVLENHGQARAADAIEHRGLGADELVGLEARAAARRAAGREQSHDRKKGLALARARLAHDADAFAALDASEKSLTQLTSSRVAKRTFRFSTSRTGGRSCVSPRADRAHRAAHPRAC
jgi:hypothetical protein